MLIKEEIVAEVLKLMYHTGIPESEICVVGQSAATLWNVLNCSKYITLYISPDAYDEFTRNEWMNALEYSPKLIGDVGATPGMMARDTYTLLMHPSFYDMKRQMVKDIPVCSVDYAVKGLSKLRYDYPYKDKIEMVLKFFEDVGEMELEFVRKLVSFDKYYHYSDDINVYRAGKKRESELLEYIGSSEKLKSISELLNGLVESK